MYIKIMVTEALRKENGTIFLRKEKQEEQDEEKTGISVESYDDGHLLLSGALG